MLIRLAMFKLTHCQAAFAAEKSLKTLKRRETADPYLVQMILLISFNTPAVKALVNHGVITGYPDNTFRPANTLTREEACAILCRLLGVSNPTGSAPFSDTSGNWAEGYIAYCYREGIVAGNGKGQFMPKDTLTGSAWAKMLLCAMGYDADEQGMTGSGWEFGVAKLASSRNLSQGISNFAITTPISRDEACQLAYNGFYRD